MTSEEQGRRPRRYSDREVRKVLDRAAALEKEGALIRSDVDGPTLDELQEIAEEAGMDPAAVRMAAEELEGREKGTTPSRTTGLPVPGTFPLGAPLTRSLSRVVEGELSAETLERMVAPVEHGAGGAEAGHVTVLSRSLTWRSGSSDDKPELSVSVSSDGGETRIRIEERYHKVAGMYYGGIMGGIGCGVGFGVGMGVGFGAMESVLFATIFPITMLSGTYLAARAALKNKVSERARALEEMADDLVRIAERGAGREELASGSDDG